VAAVVSASRRTPATLALAAVAVALSVAPASAQSKATCPASIAPVKGGSGGFDGGSRDGEPKYSPGEIIVSLRRSATKAQLACVARELGATIVDRGARSAGVGGVRNTVVMSLPAGMSVTATANRLNESRYRRIVHFAQPDWIPQLKAQAVNDPGFKYQWGLSNQMYVPANGEEARSAVFSWPSEIAVGPPSFLLKRRFSIGAARAWRVLKGRPLSTAKVVVIDSGVYAHDDLTNVAPAGTPGSRIFRDDAASSRQRLTVRADGGTFRLVGSDAVPGLGCPIRHDAASAVVKAALQKPNVLCDAADPVSWEISVAATGGDYRVNYKDRQQVAVERSAPIATGSGPDEVAAAIQSGSNGKLVRGREFEAWRNARGRVVVTFADRNAEVTVTSISLVNGAASGTVAADSWNPVRSVTGKAGSQGGPGGPYVVTFTDPGTEAVTAEASALTGAGARVWVTRDAGSRTEDQGRWPCRQIDWRRVRDANGNKIPKDPATYGTEIACVDFSHGTDVLGMVGATANNRIGIAGAAGPGPARLWMLNPLGGLQTTAAAVDYATDELKADVVNMSLGWGGRQPGRRPTTVLPSFRAPDPIDPDIVNEAFTNVPANNRTLFVVAAGNESGNLNDPGPTDNALRQNERGVDQYPCRPKDGGTRSLLQMPDGTYDRGNILCVGAVDWFGRSAYFTNWGRGVVDVGAPGIAILGTGENNLFDTGNGTSYASPIVAGIAAMIYQAYPAIEPSVAKCAILSSATSKPLPPASPVDTAVSLPNDPPVSDPFAAYAGARGNAPAQLPADGQAFTVQGMPQADEALSAAGSLMDRVARAKARPGAFEMPKCVQKRDKKKVWRDTPLWN
jgi:hypothetical protein